MAYDYEVEQSIWQAKEAERAHWDTWHQAIMSHVLPRKAFITEKHDYPDLNEYDDLFDVTAIEATGSLANMMTSQLTPVGTKFLRWSAPPPFDEDEEIGEWYKRLSEVANRFVANSNFHGVSQEFNLDKAGPGTGAMFTSRGKTRLFNFQHIELGSYCFEEDEEGRPNAIWRKLERTAAQAVAMFPEAEFGAKVAGALADPRRAHRDKFVFRHIVRPREKRDRNKITAQNMPWESVWISEEDRKIIYEGGFETFPFMVSRFQKFGNQQLWGVSPARKALPAIHQVNFLQELMDELCEVSVNPRVLSIAELVGEIDYRAAGETLVDASIGDRNFPREWLTGGRYDVGKDRIEQKQEQIKRMFYSSLWGDLSHDSKARTATEIEEIVRRDRLMFAPVASQHAADFEPTSATLFQIILDEPGMVPPPPKQLLKDGEIPDPVTSFESPIYRALKEQEVASYDYVFERAAMAAQFDPDVFDELDMAAAIRHIAEVKGVNPVTLRDPEEVAEIRRAKAQAQQTEQALGAAQAVAEVDSKSPRTAENLRQAAGAPAGAA